MSTNLLFKWFKREMAFFWVGMLIIPVFWVWWTLHPRFKAWERALAIKWTAVWITIMWVRLDQLPDYFDAAAVALPNLCTMLALYLWALFIFRHLGFSALLLLVLSAGAPLSQITRMLEQHPIMALMWFVLAVACNLLLNPTRRLLRLFELRLHRRLIRWWYD